MRITKYLFLTSSIITTFIGIAMLIESIIAENANIISYINSIFFILAGISLIGIYKNFLEIARVNSFIILAIAIANLFSQILQLDSVTVNVVVKFSIFGLYIFIASETKQSRENYLASMWLLTIIFIISILSLFNYILNLQNSYGWFRFFDSNPYISIGFFVLSIAIFTQLLIQGINKNKKVSKSRILINRFTAWFVFIASLLITFISWLLSEHYAQKSAKESFAFAVEDAENRILERMHAYEQVLSGGVGFAKSSDFISKAEWRDYVNNLHIERYYPGIQGIGLSVMVESKDKALFEEKMKTQLQNPNFEIKPNGEREIYSSIIYLEPLDVRNQQAIGYDMYSNKTRQQAMNSARDSGKTAISGRVILVQEIDRDVQSGFLMYLPLYKKDMPTDTIEERKKALSGFIYSPFRMNDLMNGILGKNFQNLSMKVYDDDSFAVDKLLYDSNPQDRDTKEPQYSKKSTLILQNRIWGIEFFSTHQFEKFTSSNQPSLVAFVGLTIDIMLFFMVHYLIKVKIELEEQQELLISQSRISAIGDMVRNLAHQWRQPLNSINLGIYLIEETLDEVCEKSQQSHSEIKNCTSTILNTTNYLSKTIDDFRTFFEDNSEKSNFNIVKTIEDTISIISPQLNALSISISFSKLNIGIGFDTLSYQTKLKQVILNILYNAKDAILTQLESKKITKGEILISIKLNENSVIIDIEDNGGGIDVEIIDRIYEPYFTTRFESQGKGLGLYMAKMIIEKHLQGEITASNRENGAVFSIKIPLVLS